MRHTSLHRDMLGSESHKA